MIKWVKKVLRKPYYKFIEIWSGGYHKELSFFYSYRYSGWKIKGKKTFEERAEKTAQLVLSALELAKKDLKGNIRIGINCWDYVDKDKRILAYTKSKEQKNIILIPDFSFMNWKQCGIEDYDKTCQEIVEASKIEPVYSTLFWIGNVRTHPSRVQLCEMAEKDKRIEAYGMSWIRNEKGQTATKYVSLVDHTKYRYLIDVQGNGWSARTKLLLFTGRPLFLVDRKWQEYWYDEIEAYVHYIPVKEDLSDLTRQLDWAEEHQEEVKRIAENAQKFAIKHLTRECAITYLAEILRQLANTNIEGKEEINGKGTGNF